MLEPPRLLLCLIYTGVYYVVQFRVKLNAMMHLLKISAFPVI